MVLGTKHLSKFFTLTKNILYYQGRIRPGMQGCDLNTATINNEVCTTLAPKQPNPLAIHLITDEESRMVIAKYFEDLHLSNFTIYYYDFGSLTEVYNYAPNELFHPRIHVWRGRCLAWLPSHYCTWIDKMIGGVFELTEALKGRMDSPQQPMIGNGFNSGVLLLHLARMRQQRWNEMWREVVRDIAETDKHLAFPDQIFNIIVYKNRHYFYELPCEWNVLVTRSAPVQVCPVAWIVGVNNRQNCLISPQSGLRLVGVVHHCRKPKPGDVFNETFRNRIPIKTVQLFKIRPEKPPSAQFVVRTEFPEPGIFQQIMLS
ncbi:unnamed protein product [Calicophoron daubneyi]|uniref:Glycosyltransferase family 92 protein n=1 Tax=Calicophoron daubneyi TaxID=300641 RepID=A0AAV2T0K8_CALDB